MTIILTIFALTNKNGTVEKSAFWLVAGLAWDAFALALLAFMK
jgi:hypothetical protein